METFYHNLMLDWDHLLRILPRLLGALIILLACLLIGRLVSRGILNLLEHAELSKTHRSFFSKLIVWGFGILGIMPTLNVLGLKNITMSLLAGGGITAVVLGFAFRGIGENLLAGFFLAFSRPFEIGDLIQSEQLSGEVKAIELRNTHIRTDDGRDIFIPSSQIFNSPLINFTKDGLRRLSFTIGIDYADNAAEARRLLLQAVEEIPEILKNPPTLVALSSFSATYVELEVLFWIDTFQQGLNMVPARTLVMERCRATLKDQGFTFSAETTSNICLDFKNPIDMLCHKNSMKGE
ncbi:MAG: mechanosensitive ion channel family protein [Proteobacteria bacterium]|nr:mechanosensitive ion channel family protein [Pseudomonadota bacterium]MBU1709159.1 mechanosensitive ion channel family protein [Pseudomonadota bacterium]